MLERRVIEVEGTVQGVGFRPFVHRLAAAGELRGFVRNNANLVVIDIEGETTGLDAFCAALRLAPPPLSEISALRMVTAPVLSHDTFRIVPSVVREHIRDDAATGISQVAPAIPPDVATCDACLAEMKNPANRRYLHPFITCTDCGPRYTIVCSAPFDRERTTMAAFARCPACDLEYHNPLDRRFHAEAISCHACGPSLTAYPASDVAPLAAACAVLQGGGVVALKALGGFHLACSATDFRAVSRLRERKHRPTKPLAVMVRDIAGAGAIAELTADDAAALTCSARPIVLVQQRMHGATSRHELAGNIAPGNSTLGVMLPSTPLHHLLLSAMNEPLVMTSGNRSGEPVAIDDDSARHAFGDVADLILSHDRDIAARCDDSVVQVVAGAVRHVRRARGQVPRTIQLAAPARGPVLAMGGHLKNTVCLLRGHTAYLSAHVGDMDSVASRDALLAAIADLIVLADAHPTIIAHDMHPGYVPTSMAEQVRIDRGISRMVAVQHHHAHVAACTAEYGVRAPVIGIVFDGAGAGTDGAVWGGEFLVVSGAQFVRAGHLRYVTLPGGDAAARKPWRSAVTHLASAGVNAQLSARFRPAAVLEADWELVRQLALHPHPQHRTSSVGRLFDAVASLIGVCHSSHHEGEAAMALEAIATENDACGYPLTLGAGAPWTVDAAEIIQGVLSDIRRGRSVPAIASAFHASVRDLVVLGAERIREDTGVTTVVLSGGVFMNKRLTEGTVRALEARRFRVLLPRAVPVNDGGLALGQAHVAACALEDESCV